MRSTHLHAALAILLTVPAFGAQPKPELDSYGGYSGIRGEKTGYFHTQQIKDRWMLVDPDGNGFFAIAMDSLGHYPSPTAQGPGPAWTDPSVERVGFDKLLLQKYPAQEDWAKAQLDRLRAMGFNAVTNFRRSTSQAYPHAEFAAVSPKESEALNDVFSAEFVTRVNDAADQKCRPYAEDKTLIGYFSDNELPWAKVWGGGFLDDYLSLPDGAAGHEAAMAFIKQRYPKLQDFDATWDSRASSKPFKPGPKFDRLRAAADRDAFLELVARRYYSTVYQAFKKADPKHLVLGTRFLTGEVPLAVARGMRGYVDVVSCNFYGIRSFPVRFFRDFSEAAGAPILLTEFGTSAFDSGIPMDHSGAIPRVVETQQERADLYAWYLQTALSMPEIVGVCWWWMLDGFAGRNVGNFGFVNWKDELWQVLADRAFAVNHTAYQELLAARSPSMPAQTQYPIRKRLAPGMDIVLDKSLKYEGHGFDQAGLHAEATITQDDKNLYFSVRVYDKDVKTYTRKFIDAQHPNIWEMDGVEIRLGSIQGLLYFDGKKPSLSLVPSDPMPGVHAFGRILKDGYFLEALIPKASFIHEIHEGKIRLAIGVNDGVAGERYRQLQWPASFEWIYPETYALGDLNAN